MSSTDNRTEIRYVCGSPIRCVNVEYKYYGGYDQYVTCYWEGAAIGVMNQDFWNHKSVWVPLKTFVGFGR